MHIEELLLAFRGDDARGAAVTHMPEAPSSFAPPRFPPLIPSSEALSCVSRQKRLLLGRESGGRKGTLFGVTAETLFQLQRMIPL